MGGVRCGGELGGVGGWVSLIHPNGEQARDEPEGPLLQGLHKYERMRLDSERRR